MIARFLKGDPIWSDVVPAGTLAAGDIIITGDSCLVLHSPGVTGVEMGAAKEGGIYEITLGATLAEGAHIDYVTATGKFVAAGSGDAYFGRLEPGNGGVLNNLRRATHYSARTILGL